ncbi:MAG: MBL fold metallo-hydrolase [Syntrophomonadaceae bacterium]
MDLTVLGCWAAYPAAGQACSGYVVRNDDTSILLDCGHAVFSKLWQYDDYINLDAVFISHFHPDHYVDLYALRHAIRGAIYMGKRKQPLKVYLPPKPAEIVDQWLGLPELEVKQVEEGMSINVSGLKLSFFATTHPVPGLAVRLTSGDSSLFYSGDTSLSDNLIEASRQVKVLLAECTMADIEQDYAAARGHMTTRDVGEWVKRSKPGLLLATHFWEGSNREELKQALSSHCEADFIMAYEGLKLTI